MTDTNKKLRSQLKAAENRVRELASRICDLENVEREYRESGGQDIFQHIFLESSSPMLLVDPVSGLILDCNTAASSFYGYAQEKMRTMHIREINQLAPEPLRQAITQVKNRECDHFFFRHKLASGKIRDVEVYTGPITLKGKQVYYSIVHDITERRRTEEALRVSEERLRMALEVSSIAVWDWNVVTNRMLRVTQRGSYAGIESRYLGTTFADFINRVHPMDQADMRETIERTVAKGTPYRAQYRIMGPDGQTHFMKSKGEPQYDATGKVVRVVGVTQNVTAERLAAEELLRAKEEAEAANRSKSAFLANMSHEIRTPLSGVLGMLELMSMSDVPEDFRELLDNATRSSRNLKELLTDILDLSKIEAGKLEIENRSFNLAEMAENSLRMFTDRAQARGIQLDLDIQDLDRPVISLDPMRTRQILFNLLGNAIKFTDIGYVRLECMNLPPNGGYDERVVVVVSDTGVGIPQRMLQRIFEPFTQLDDSHAKRFQGSGLGLSIVRRIVELMGGTLMVDSEVNRGTDIAVCLPVHEARPCPDSFAVESADCGPMAEDSHRAPQKTPHDMRPDAPPLEPLRILVAEDDSVNRLAAQRMLERQGHEVHTVSDGTQVLGKLAGARFDCVLMDVQMPVLDGVEATRLIRWAERQGELTKIPVIALTAYAMKGDEERLLKAGMDGYVAKPLDMAELNRVLSSLLG